MALFGRRRKLPESDRPALERDERVIAWASSPRGAVVATNRGLWLPDGRSTAPAGSTGPTGSTGSTGSPGSVGGATGAGSTRLGWHEIHKAVWTGEALAVTAARLVERGPGYDVVADRPTVEYRLTDPGDLPAQVRARVTRSVGPSTHHSLPGSGGVRVVARRVPGADGLAWTARYDPGVDHDDPIVREATAALVEQARLSVPG